MGNNCELSPGHQLYETYLSMENERLCIGEKSLDEFSLVEPNGNPVLAVEHSLYLVHVWSEPFCETTLIVLHTDAPSTEPNTVVSKMTPSLNSDGKYKLIGGKLSHRNILCLSSSWKLALISLL